MRTPLEDLKWAVAVLAGATLAWLVFGGGDDPSPLLGAALAGVLVVVVVRGVLRWRRGRRAA
jgi:hypothetical protein